MYFFPVYFYIYFLSSKLRYCFKCVKDKCVEKKIIAHPVVLREKLTDSTHAIKCTKEILKNGTAKIPDACEIHATKQNKKQENSH